MKKELVTLAIVALKAGITKKMDDAVLKAMLESIFGIGQEKAERLINELKINIVHVLPDEKMEEMDIPKSDVL